MNEELASRVLRSLPREKRFYFFTSIGNYTGQSATSLKEFLDKISEVNIKSLEFHFHRGDFEKWIVEVLEDRKLAEEVSSFRSSLPIGMKLKSGLHRILTRRYSELQGHLQP